MSYSTDALYDYAAHDPRRFTPQAIPKKSSLLPQNILGGLALALIAATCLWTVGSYLAGDQVATFDARFGDLPAAKSVRTIPRVTVVRKGVQHQHAGLFDTTQLSRTRGTFSGGQSAALAQHLAPVTTSGAPQLQASAASRPA